MSGTPDHEELGDLLHKAVEGQLEAGDERRLNSLLSNDHEARQLFHEYGI